MRLLIGLAVVLTAGFREPRVKPWRLPAAAPDTGAASLLWSFDTGG